MDIEFGLKELTDLTLKTTYNIEIGGKKFEPGEVVARFDKIQIANLQEITSRVSANGGYGNATWIVWEDPKEIQINFTQGIFSKRQFALLNNAKLIKEDAVSISDSFVGESDENGKIFLRRKRVSQVFVYDAMTNEKIKPLDIDLEEGVITIEQQFLQVEVDFVYKYQKSTNVATIGQKLFSGYLQLEGRTRTKDDITGRTRTAILRIPRVKLVSDLSLRLGREAAPVLGEFNAVGLPSGGRGDKKIMELFFLEDDIDAEM